MNEQIKDDKVNHSPVQPSELIVLWPNLKLMRLLLLHHVHATFTTSTATLQRTKHTLMGTEEGAEEQHQAVCF